MERIECVVIGAGVVGLAIARRLAQTGRDVLVLEAADDIGTGISSRNSEVIHAGLYYPARSVMAQTCVAGKRALYAYCADHGVAHRRCGKLIVATSPDDSVRLAAIQKTFGLDTQMQETVVSVVLIGAIAGAFLAGWAADRFGRRWTLIAAGLIFCVGALLSPSTGIIDSHGLMLALRGDLEDAGGAIAFRAPFSSARAVAGGFEIETGGDDPAALTCDLLINAGGLHATAIAHAIQGVPSRAMAASSTRKECQAWR